MDFFNKAKQFAEENQGSFTGGNNSTNNNNNNNNAGAGSVDAAAQGSNAADAGNNGGQQEDYGDKGLDFIEKKAGHTLSREQNEKITDGARGLFEKATGRHIDSKYSN